MAFSSSANQGNETHQVSTISFNLQKGSIYEDESILVTFRTNYNAFFTFNIDDDYWYKNDYDSDGNPSIY